MLRSRPPNTARMITTSLSSADMQALNEWVRRNEAAHLAHCLGPYLIKGSITCGTPG
jgi:hypothetical protein